MAKKKAKNKKEHLEPAEDVVELDEAIEDEDVDKADETDSVESSHENRVDSQSEEEDEAVLKAQTELIEKTIKSIIKAGKEKGHLTYEEINDALPDEIISPARLDSLLMTLDELGVQLLDEADIEKGVDEDFEEEAEKVGRGDGEG